MRNQYWPYAGGEHMAIMWGPYDATQGSQWQAREGQRTVARFYDVSARTPEGERVLAALSALCARLNEAEASDEL